MVQAAQAMDDDSITDEPIEEGASPPSPAPRIAYRHRLPTRIWHWVNAITVIVMLMSGLMILNAHPRLYWGWYGANFDHAWINFGARPFPGWATIPSTYNLAAGRVWHLAFAWVLVIGLAVFLLTSLWNRHGQRGLAPTADELPPPHAGEGRQEHGRAAL